MPDAFILVLRLFFRLKIHTYSRFTTGKICMYRNSRRDLYSCTGHGMIRTYGSSDRQCTRGSMFHDF